MEYEYDSFIVRGLIKCMCKLERYGNCDEETKDNEYCIFHKPNKNKEEAREFRRKFLERFKPRKEIIPTKFGEVKRFVFEDEVDCQGFVFPEIPEDFDFFFDYAVFKETANLSGATFKRISKVIFNWATFEKDAEFFGVIFEGETLFFGATFKGKTWFDWATFEDYVHFGLKKDDEEYMFYSELSFSNTVFKKGINIIEPIKKGWFKLPQARAEACRVQRLSYEKEGKRDDADRIFVIERRALRENRVWNAKSYMKEAKGKAKLKSALGLIKTYGSSFIEWIIADLTCEYGTNWIKPVILWIFTVLFLFPVLYWALSGVRVQSLFDYWYFSIVTATTLGYGDLHPIGLGKALASAEAIFGTFMWAVFLAVFARKYMR